MLHTPDDIWASKVHLIQNLAKSMCFRKNQISPPGILEPLISLPLPANFNLRYVPPSMENTDEDDEDTESDNQIKKDDSDGYEPSTNNSSRHIHL